MADKELKDLTAASSPLTSTWLIAIANPAGGSGTMQKATLAQVQALPAPTIRTVSGTTGTFADGDVNNIVDCTSASTCTMTIPNSLTVQGSLTVRAGGTGDVVIAAGAGVTLDEPGSRTTLTTQYQFMAAIYFGSLTHYSLSGAES